ncbi:autotransporter-associated beta strand repeat-containing protein [Variovorax sp. KK3]|nr:autotransporter-associated beta strand repeat-containing protein [Variovorax sp. KK3]
MDGGSLTLGGRFEVRGNSVAGGAAGGGGAQGGAAFGSGIFMQGGSSALTFAPDVGNLQTVSDVIADQTGSGGAGAHAGSIGLVKTGAGRLVLAAANTYSGGTIVTGGRLSIEADQNLGASDSTLTLDGGALQNTVALTTGRAIVLWAGGGGFQTDADLRLAGVVAGTGFLVKRGAAILTLTGPNTYAGGTVLSEGKLSVSADANLGSSSGSMTFDGGTLQVTGGAFVSTPRTITWGVAGGGFDIVQSDTTFTVPQALAGPGGLSKEGAGTLVLSGTNRYAGGTSLHAGTLVGSAGSFGSGGIVDNAALLIDQPVDAVFANAVSGRGSLGKTGAGTLVLTGTSSYTGGTVIDAGALQVGDGGSHGAIVGDVTNNGALVFNRGDASTFPGAISGSGAVVKRGSGTLTLTGANTYSGGTTIIDGKLSVSADRPLGSGRLALDGGTLQVTGTAFEATSRNVFLGANGGGIDIVGVDATFAVEQAVTGQGALTKDGAGTLVLANAGSYEGGTTIRTGTLRGHAASFGSGRIDNAAELHIDQPSDATLANTVTGIGKLIKTGGGMLTLAAENRYSGGTDLKQGGIAIGNNNALGSGGLAMHEGTTLRFAADRLVVANPIVFTDAVDPTIDTGPFTATIAGGISGPGMLSKIGSGTLVLAGVNTYAGTTAVNEGTLRAAVAGTFSAGSVHDVVPGAVIDLAGFSQRMAGLNNGGVVSLVGVVPGTTLTVTGAYAGTRGVLRLGTFLESSSSVSDRLVLDGAGAIASGRTVIQVLNQGGLGALTTGNGIELVGASNGAATTAQGTRDAFSLLGEHVDAGAYEYRLHAGDLRGAGQNWYLRSTAVAASSEPAKAPSEATAPSSAAATSTETVKPPTDSLAAILLPTYRAEVPLLAALPEQLRQGHLVMLGNLHQRIGDDDRGLRSSASDTEGQPRDGHRFWSRVVGAGRTLRQAGMVTPWSELRLGGIQAGTDLWVDSDWRAGIYIGQLDGDARVRGFARGVANLAVGSNELRNQYAGGYATYRDAEGFYVDAVLQAGRHRYVLEPFGGQRVEGKGGSLSASLETGQLFRLGEGWHVEPQLQLVHLHNELDAVDIVGARVQQDRAETWLARLGIRLKGDVLTGAGRLQPYARLNLYRASRGNDVARFSSPAAVTSIVSSTGGASAELSAGFTLSLDASTSVYGEVGRLWAVGGESRVKSQLNASAGLRMHW